MKITVKYGSNWYGNTSSNPNFNAKISRASQRGGGINLELRFAEPQAGRGANWENKGFVAGANFVLSDEEARSIAAALLWHLDCVARDSLELEFGNPPKSDA